ncbi:MAG: DUF2384 domain-containing protein [Acidobacteriia bacterium]|nr:DUF2384 domain-containing protein [Terriglobia bacterium]
MRESTKTSTKLIRKGEPGALRSLASRSGVSVSALASVIGIPKRALARRQNAGRLGSEKSERLLRIAVIVEKILDLFEGDRDAASRWLTTPRKALDRRSPLDCSRTEIGARKIENLIGQLQHGIFP